MVAPIQAVGAYIGQVTPVPYKYLHDDRGNPMLAECLRLLRKADGLLLDQNELLLAARLSLVIELLAQRVAEPI